ncbi:hypothetical protein K435DRAFT_142433 [Dendrothele bispora CBS 962.96]|uniref:FAS1 domain-containing protein n=1 Tax=Dendrothele bispora (strain CBS 962.96) TaxID=1314807 RepID=A0A4S8LZA1_DENBC|nr:hypothetical protein K435DRAFT_142433 [Dendrothele bispora CBS 962.96]
MVVDNEPEYTPQTHSQPTLADLLTIESSTSIFYSYARDVRESELFSDDSAKLTLLVPTNKAVMALARKPHQGPAKPDGDIVVSEEQFDRDSKENVRRWVSAHIIPLLSTLEPGSYNTLLDGKSINISLDKHASSSPSWGKVFVEGDIHITAMKEAANGVLYILDGTIDPN